MKKRMKVCLKKKKNNPWRITAAGKNETPECCLNKSTFHTNIKNSKGL